MNIVQEFTTELVSKNVSNLRSDRVSTVQQDQAPLFSCFLCPPSLHPNLPDTERQTNSRRPDHNLLWADRRIMCPRAQSGGQISETKLAPFPWCSFKEGRKVQPRWAGRGWGRVPSTLNLVPPSVQRDYCNCCPPEPHSGILCQESVPWSVSQKPLWAASMLCSAPLPTQAIYI